MKTKLSLTILGVYNTIVGLAMLFCASWGATQILSNTENAELVRMAELLHYGLSPAVLIIGLMLLLNRKTSLETAKNLFLAYIIGTAVLMYVFFTIMANEPLMNFGVDKAAPDVVMFLLAIYAYLKPKK